MNKETVKELAEIKQQMDKLVEKYNKIAVETKQFARMAVVMAVYDIDDESIDDRGYEETDDWEELSEDKKEVIRQKIREDLLKDLTEDPQSMKYYLTLEPSKNAEEWIDWYSSSINC